MHVNIVPIGTSKGIRIPKAILEQLHIKGSVNMEIRGSSIILKPQIENPRQGWEDACQKMHELKDDQLLYDETVDLDFEGWEW